VLVASDWAPIRAFDPIVRRNPEAVYGDLLPVLRDADLRIVNCECALTTADTAVCKSGAVFKGAPEHVDGLTAVPFDVACLANNHVLDHGVAGLRETLRVLEQHGVRTVGAGLDDETAHAPLTVAAGRTRVHVVNFSEGEDLTAARGGPGVSGWDVARVAETVRRCKRRGGVVIAIGHCGLEYVPFPPTYVVEAFRAVADAGADAVIGHHPHVPQGVEMWNGTPIAYSLGNFVFYQPVDLHYRKTGFVVTLDLADDTVEGVALHPYRITDAGLRGLDAAEARDFQRDMTRVSRPFRTRGGPARAWDAYLAHYGAAGFTAEVSMILDRMKADPRKGAAMFRNRVTTMQHAELWRGALTRLMAEAPRPASPGALAIVGDWFGRKVSASAG
jgi:poly-gamma-glutamate synthesis protein (capsule biosynthesis protein)